jgi:hypothetical protein
MSADHPLPNLARVIVAEQQPAAPAPATAPNSTSNSLNEQQHDDHDHAIVTVTSPVSIVLTPQGDHDKSLRQAASSSVGPASNGLPQRPSRAEESGSLPSNGSGNTKPNLNGNGAGVQLIPTASRPTTSAVIVVDPYANKGRIHRMWHRLDAGNWYVQFRAMQRGKSQ